jgi:hypothetical protein
MEASQGLWVRARQNLYRWSRTEVTLRNANPKLLLAGGLAILGVLYIGGLRGGPYVDDNDLIFSNAFIRAWGNPLRYWYRSQPDTKAWPLTHTVYWLSYHLFYRSFWAYRLLNLGLHGVNAFFLFRWLSERVRRSAAAFATAFFLFHPIAVEPVLWPSQIGTLLATLFLGFWLAATLRGDGGIRRFGWFAGSLASKSFAILLPCLMLAQRWREDRGPRGLAAALPAIALSFYAAFLLYVGAYQTASRFYVASPPGSSAAAPLKSVGGGRLTLVTAEPAPSGHVGLVDRVSLCGKSALYYFARVGAYAEFPADARQPSETQVWSLSYFALGLSVLVALAWFSVRAMVLPAAILLVYLPASGLFPGPPLRFSLVSDRMIYPALFFAMWPLAGFYDRLKDARPRSFLWLWITAMGVITYGVVREPRADFSYLLLSDTP